MKLKRIAISVAVLVALAVYLKWPRPYVHEGSLTGREIVSAEELAKTRRLVLSAGEASLEIKQVNGQWLVPSYDSMPASRSRLRKLFENLSENKYRRFVTRKQQRAEDLKIGSSQINLYGESNQLLQSLRLGDEGIRGGQFIAAGEEEIYLSDAAVDVETEAKSWVDFQVLRSSLSKLLACTITLADGATRQLKQDGEGNWSTDALPEGQRLNKRFLEGFLRAYLDLRWQSVLSNSDATVAAARKQGPRLQLRFEIDGFEPVTLTLYRHLEYQADPMAIPNVLEEVVSARGAEELKQTVSNAAEAKPPTPRVFVEYSQATDPALGAYLTNAEGKALEVSAYYDERVLEQFDALFEAAPVEEPEDIEADAASDTAE